jgi:hypothetical protein
MWRDPELRKWAGTDPARLHRRSIESGELEAIPIRPYSVRGDQIRRDPASELEEPQEHFPV